MALYWDAASHLDAVLGIWDYVCGRGDDVADIRCSVGECENVRGESAESVNADCHGFRSFLTCLHHTLRKVTFARWQFHPP